MAHASRIEFTARTQRETHREQQRREIANQVEQFLQHGGRIDVLSGPLQETQPVGRVWWEGGRPE